MNVILNQLGGLFLGSVPTIIFFVVLVVAYGYLVRRPLDKVLAERRARTSGAVEQARGAMSAAEAETSVFEDKLRSAKSELFHAREQRLAKWASEREALLNDARATTANRINVAKLDIEKSANAARQQIESMSNELSAKILKAVLPPGVSGAEVAQ